MICLHQCQAVTERECREVNLFLPCLEQLWPRDHVTSYVNEVVKATLLCGRHLEEEAIVSHHELFNYSWRPSVRLNSAGWLDYTQWDRSHLWAMRKLLSAKMNILIRQLSSQTILWFGQIWKTSWLFLDGAANRQRLGILLGCLSNYCVILNSEARVYG